MSRTLLVWLLASAPFLLIGSSFAACSTSEGERCNTSLSHDACASNLTCTVPTNCGYGVCCPTSGVSGNGACAACAAPEGEAPDASTMVDTDDGAADAALADGG